MCGNNMCNEMVQENSPQNQKRILHTSEECELLANSDLGSTINNFENDDIIYACIFVHRM